MSHRQRKKGQNVRRLTQDQAAQTTLSAEQRPSPCQRRLPLPSCLLLCSLSLPLLLTPFLFFLTSSLFNLSLFFPSVCFSALFPFSLLTSPNPQPPYFLLNPPSPSLSVCLFCPVLLPFNFLPSASPPFSLLNLSSLSSSLSPSPSLCVCPSALFPWPFSSPLPRLSLSLTLVSSLCPPLSVPHPDPFSISSSPCPTLSLSSSFSALLSLCPPLSLSSSLPVCICGDGCEPLSCPADQQHMVNSNNNNITAASVAGTLWEERAGGTEAFHGYV